MKKDKETIINYAPASGSTGKLPIVILTILLLLTWIFVGGVYIIIDGRIGVSTVAEGTILPDGIDQKIIRIEESITNLEARLNAQEKIKFAALPSELPEEGVGSNVELELDVVTQNELNAVTVKLKLLEEKLAKVALLESEMEQTKTLINKKNIPGKGPLIMAISQVQKQVNRGLPFDSELLLVEIQAGEDQTINQHINILRSHGEIGVSTITELQNEFLNLAGKVVKEDKKLQDSDIWSRVKNEAMNAISVRRVDNLEGSSAEAIIARAEEALKNYDITEAVFELDGLRDGPKRVIAEWMALASAKVAVDYALDGIVSRVTQVAAENKSSQ